MGQCLLERRAQSLSDLQQREIVWVNISFAFVQVGTRLGFLAQECEQSAEYGDESVVQSGHIIAGGTLVKRLRMYDIRQHAGGQTRACRFVLSEKITMSSDQTAYQYLFLR